jgi:hypothetical protein
MTNMRAFALALIVALGVIALMAAGRPGIATAACLLLPGLGWAGKLRLEDAGDRLALAIAISICALTVVGTTMVVLGRWSTPLGLVALAVVAAAGILPGRLLKNASAPLSTLLKSRPQWAARLGLDPDVSAASEDGWEQFWPPWVVRTADDELIARSSPVRHSRNRAWKRTSRYVPRSR